VAAEAVAVVAAAVEPRDRFGLGWRPELATGILAHRDRIDVVEVIADDHFGASRTELRAWRRLAAEMPVFWHGISLGLASTVPVERQRLDAMARLVGETGAAGWSEHLAFVRGGGIEIGHLAAPPRSAASVDGACANIDHARRIIGDIPSVENIATLIDPPGSDVDEPEWITSIVDSCGAGLLLDLHNLYANAVNFGADPAAVLRRLPLHRVGIVHLAGGRWIPAPNGGRRLLDDHLHAVPPAVFGLLTELGRLAPQKLTVIIERDGDYPAFADLQTELDTARHALAAGRASSR
jgi:uncharacterized protein (UPF0276 family)